MKERKTALNTLKNANELNAMMNKTKNSKGEKKDLTVYKENRLVFKHEKLKVIAANNEQISNIIVDKYG